MIQGGRVRHIGQLRHRLELQSATESRVAGGGVVKSWATQDTVWGSIEPLSGKEYLAIAQTQNEVEVRINIRYYSDIDATWRVLSGGKAYAILAVINHDEHNRFITLMCSQGVFEDSGVAETVTHNNISVTNSSETVVHTV